MASYFGEVIEPNCRAIFDEFSDEEDKADVSELEILWSRDFESLPVMFDVLYIFCGRLSLAFAEVCLLDKNSKPVAEINVEKNRNDRKTLPSRLYFDNKIAICLVSPSLSSHLEYEFSDTILPVFKVSKNIVIFINDSIHNYKTPKRSELDSVIIRELKTSHESNEYVAKPLETPNFITGIPAGIISWCQIFKKKASVFICYTDQQKLDSITALPYITILKKLNSNVIKNENISKTHEMFYGEPEIIGGFSNIYV